ncbi:MAG TPA: FKBP-type peptidyl-prolyl cis-trans isomerase [Parafilimonas sp.]|nr:FKBP-type peptidyl-prolyl cis-trans isomerase [Parafilimonas sp.]
MKRLIFLFSTVFFLISCSKKNDNHCTPVTPDSEAGEMTSFCDVQGISYTVDTNGIYYQVIDQGSGMTPNLNSVVTVTYMAATLDGNVVADNTATAVAQPLNQFIEGWRLALPYIQQGGRIKMILPSVLAYGCTGISGEVPPNSPLYYDIVLKKVE